MISRDLSHKLTRIASWAQLVLTVMFLGLFSIGHWPDMLPHNEGTLWVMAMLSGAAIVDSIIGIKSGRHFVSAIHDLQRLDVMEARNDDS